MNKLFEVKYWELGSIGENRMDLTITKIDSALVIISLLHIGWLLDTLYCRTDIQSRYVNLNNTVVCTFFE